MGNFFWTNKAIEKQPFFIFQPILKISNLTNPRYIKDFVEAKIHCIVNGKPVNYLTVLKTVNDFRKKLHLRFHCTENQVFH